MPNCPKSLNFTDSKLTQFNPFVGPRGLLLAGGRIGKAPIPFSQRHPILLPPKDPTVHSYIHYVHVLALHAGPDHVFHQIRRNVWVIQGRQACRSVVAKCVLCQRRKKSPKNPRMGEIPRQRLEAAIPFQISAVDLCGPIMTKNAGRSLNKIYLVIFCCCMIRAVHIEIVHSLSFQAFVGALNKAHVLR